MFLSSVYTRIYNPSNKNIAFWNSPIRFNKYFNHKRGMKIMSIAMSGLNVALNTYEKLNIAI